MTFSRFFRSRPTRIFKILIVTLVLLSFFYVTSLLYGSDRNHFEFLDGFIMKSKIVRNGIVLEDGLSENAKRFLKELKLENPGEDGKPVELDEKLLTEEHKALIKQGWEEYGCNVFVSDLISLNRKIPDIRSEYCKRKKYSKDLPKVSVVIVFYNEALSILLRTVHSILINTPEHLLEEIVLVDDFSSKEDLKENLKFICQKLKKVKIIRAHQRLGVSGAKVLGFKNSKGPVIASFDSHSELPVGWLEPFLDRMKDNPTLAVTGEIKGISSEHFGFEVRNWRKSTAFKWDLSLSHIRVTSYEPVTNPLLDGPSMIFWKDFAERIGYIDEDFDIYGGDVVEFSLKHWLCGGSIELVPCSPVLHLSRVKVYDEATEKGGSRYNNDRIVESWFDDNYKKFYYRTVGDTKERNFGDISKNIELKERLNCKDISWYFQKFSNDFKIPKEISDDVWDEKMKKTLKAPSTTTEELKAADVLSQISEIAANFEGQDARKLEEKVQQLIEEKLKEVLN